MDIDDYKALWRTSAPSSAHGAWTPEQIASFRERRSRSISAFMMRSLTKDVVIKALALVALATAAWLNRHDPVVFGSSLALLAATLWLLRLVLRARRAFGAASATDADVRGATLRLCAEVERFRRGPLFAVAVSETMLMAAGFLIYFTLEHGEFRPWRVDQWLIIALGTGVPFAATSAVLSAHLRSSVTTLRACAQDLDADAFRSIERTDRRARWAQCLFLAVVTALLLAGIFFFALSCSSGAGVRNPERLSPAGPDEGTYLTAEDGTRLFVFTYPPPGRPESTVYLLAGITEINHRAALYGKDYVDAIRRDIAARPAGEKRFLFGHSMSTAMVLAVENELGAFDGVILVNPPFELTSSPGMNPTIA